MISASNIDVAEVLRKFRHRGVDVCFLVPTETGLRKSIMDATDDVRHFLKRNRLHDYQTQLQGQGNKKVLPSLLASGNSVFQSETSLYRPNTKLGDPRIWISRLKTYASPGDLLALTAAGQGLLVINCSTTNLDVALGEKPTSMTASIATEQQKFPPYLIALDQIPLYLPLQRHSSNYEELLAKLKEIGGRRYIKTMAAGDTGVGYTLETLLGIPRNSLKTPDYKGIEIKASRHHGGRRQATVFSQVPDWSISRLHSSKQLLMERGHASVKGGPRRLYHEISAVAPNSFGLKLEISQKEPLLHQVYVSGPDTETDVSWALDQLKARLLEKHQETVWVTAKTQGHNENEAFWYYKLKHTAEVDPDILPLMLQMGVMTVHYTIKETTTGGAKDKGYLFKTATRNLDLLFKRVEEVELCSHIAEDSPPAQA